MTLTRISLAFTLALAACDSGSAPAPSDATVDTSSLDATPDVSSKPDVPEAIAAMIRARPYSLRVPTSYTADRAWPLVLLIHGYGAAGLAQAAYLGLTGTAERRGFLLAMPDGTLDATGRRFWNATDACCDFGGTRVDDVAYLTAVVDDVAARFRVDPGRVFVIGHSNGGFMTNRIACDRADRFAAAVSIAGATWSDSARCAPARTISMLLVHGVGDATVSFEGGSLDGRVNFPSARNTAAAWARLNRCDATFTETSTRGDYDTAVSGEETRVGRHENCAPGGASELWSMEGSGHIPGFNTAWNDAVVDWLEAHARR